MSEGGLDKPRGLTRRRMLEAGLAAAALAMTSKVSDAQSRILPEQSLLNALDTPTLPTWKDGLERCRKFLTDDTVHAGGANQLTVIADETQDSRIQWATPHANEARSPRLMVRADAEYVRTLTNRVRISVNTARYIQEINTPGAGRDRSGYYQNEMFGNHIATAMREAEKTGIYPSLPLTEWDLGHFNTQTGPESYLWYMGNTRSYGSENVSVLASISSAGMWYARPFHSRDASDQAYMDRLPDRDRELRDAFDKLQRARKQAHELLQEHTAKTTTSDYHALCVELEVTTLSVSDFEKADALTRTRTLARLVLKLESTYNDTQKGPRTQAFLASMKELGELTLLQCFVSYTRHDLIVKRNDQGKLSLNQAARSFAATSSEERLKPGDYEDMISRYRTVGFDAEFVPKERMGDKLPSAVFQ